MSCDQSADGSCVLALARCPRVGALCVRAAAGSEPHIALVRELAGDDQAEPPKPSPRLAILDCPDRIDVEPG